MLPIYKEDKLSVAKITNCWTREIQPPRSREELQDFLEAAWWRGELKTGTSFTRLALLKSLFRSARAGDLPKLVFVTQENPMLPQGIELPDGGRKFDRNDLERPRIPVPLNDPETWTEASCESAFEVLAQAPSRRYYTDRTIQFLMMEIYHNQFIGLLSRNGLDWPNFWRAAVEKPQQMEEEVQGPTGVPPVIAQAVDHGRSETVAKGPFGPEPGKLRRYEAADRALFPELERIMDEQQKSRWAAALDLAQAGKIKGFGTDESRAKRLAALYKRERGGAPHG